MYFWRIRKLRHELVIKPLSEKDSVNYLMAFTIFYFVLIFLHALHPRDYVSPYYLLFLLSFFTIKIGGIYYCYRTNGGNKGEFFLQRYLALAFVEMMRFILIGLILLICSVLAMAILAEEKHLYEHHFWFAVIYLLILIVCYYWRLSEHFRYVSTNRKLK